MNLPATSSEKVSQVIDLVLDGSTLRAALKQCGMTPQQFGALLKCDREASAAYARAAEIRADLMADEIISIADSDADPAKARNQIAARQWLAGKLFQRRYGERIDLNVTQTIDVGSTLAEAKARLSARYQQNIEDAQVIDLPSITDQSARDTESRELSNTAAPDIFD